MAAFSDAYASAGYTVRNPRNQWSATREDGRVAVTVWDDEIERGAEPLVYDMSAAHPKLDLWVKKPANAARARHIADALAAGRLDFDLILVKAEDPREDPKKIKSARHWFERIGRVREGTFDPAEGTFVMELHMANH